MTTAGLVALLPLLLVAATSVVVMIAVAVGRNHAVAFGLTLAGLAASFCSVFYVHPQQVTMLLVMDRYALFFMGLIVAASFHGVIAIAWAVLASGLFAVAINTWYSKKLLGYGVAAQLRDQSATLLLSAGAAGVAWLVSHWLTHATLALAVAIVAAAMTYFGAAALFRVTAWRELLEMLKALRTSNPASAETAGHSP